MTDFSRRQFVSMSALALGGAVLPARALLAQDVQKITVTAFGGIWEQALREAFVADFQRRSGKSADVLIGTPAQWMSQIQASMATPPIHALVNSMDMALAAGREGLVEQVSADRIPALADVPKSAVDICKGWGAIIAYSAAGFAYHERLKNPPKSITEFVDGTIEGRWRAALPGIGYTSMPAMLLWSMADAMGGSIDNLDPAFTALIKMKPNVVFWNGINDPLVQLESGEADIAVYFDGRTYSHRDSGAQWINFVNPSEGGVMIPSVIQKVKNGPELAWDFLQSVLSPEPQAVFAAKLNYGMSNQKVKYPPPLDERVVRWDDTRIPPYERISDIQPQVIERWNKEIGG